MNGLELGAARLERRLERVEYALSLGRVIGGVVAYVDVDGHETRFGPRMDRKMRFGKQHGSGNSVRLELEETIADDRETRFVDHPAAQVTQRIGLRQQRFGRATVPFAQQMDSFHRMYPPGTAFRAGVFRIPEQPLPMSHA